MTADADDVIAAMLVGWIWNVYARSSWNGVVASGVAEHEDGARLNVQDVMRRQADLAGFGVVVDLASGVAVVCWRSGEGFAWRPVRS